VQNLDVVLSYESTDESIIAKLKFVDVATFRAGSPNDHGFYDACSPGTVNDSNHSHGRIPEGEFGNFYEVSGIDWSNGLKGKGTKILQSIAGPRNVYRRFVFFMRDGTFEVVCNHCETLHDDAV
jgi:hypothetical protein